MANIRIKLNSNRKIVNGTSFSDIDVESKNISSTLKDRQAVLHSISNILKWKPFERILNPSFGNSLWNSIFENIGKSSRSDIISAVKKMLKSEPRINVLDVEVTTNVDANEIYISFKYTIPSLDNIIEKYSITMTKD